jgi:hypothetical protein
MARFLHTKYSLKNNSVAPAESPSRGNDSEADASNGTLEKDGQPKSASDKAPVPFYKKRSFIISQIILTPIGIALIFILLFPVVLSIVQLTVNKATLDIQTATISNPTNTS